MPATSVILPTHRRPALLRRAIESILNQTFADFEIIVVDNNPTRSRVAAIPEHLSWLRDQRVQLVEDAASKNPAALRNRGLAIARGDWVTFLDDDDEFYPQKLARQLQAAEASQLTVGLCQLRFRLPWRRRIRGRMARELTKDELLFSFPGMPAVFHRRTPAVRFEETLNAGEDGYYFQALLQHFKASQVFNVPEPLVDVHVQPDSHVNLNAEASWNAAEATLRDFGSFYTSAAQRAFRLQTRLAYCKIQRGRFGEMLAISATLLRERHLQDARLILNCCFFKMPWARRWLIS